MRRQHLQTLTMTLFRQLLRRNLSVRSLHSKPAHNMPLELHALQESDMGVAYELMWETFKPDIMGLMYPDGINDAVREWSNSTSLASWRKDPERYKKNKVIDTDLPDNDPFGKIVGVADWEFYPKYRTKEEREKSSAENEKDGLPPLINGTMMKEFIGQLGEAKEEQLGGKPFVYLHILATHPKHHRRGVGAMHLRWGFEQAEKLGLPVYLESSPMGRPLYARNGFEIKGWLPFDARKYGSEKELPHALMLRPAKGEVDAK